MRTSVCIICLSSFVTVTAGCDLFGPASSLSHAAATWGCGPAGGSTVVILLSHDPIGSAPSAPYVSVEIWQPTYPLAAHTWSVGTNNPASAMYVPWPGTTQWASSGSRSACGPTGRSRTASSCSITITSVDSTKTVEGVLDLQFPSRMVATQFKAPWIASSGGYCN